MNEIQKLKKAFEENLYFSQIGFEIVEFSEDDVVLRLPIKEELLNLSGMLHGGIHATLLDWLFGMLVRIETNESCATISLNTHYLKPISHGYIYAKGKIVQSGYRIITVEGEVFDDVGMVLAKGIATFAVFRNKKKR